MCIRDSYYTVAVQNSTFLNSFHFRWTMQRVQTPHARARIICYGLSRFESSDTIVTFTKYYTELSTNRGRNMLDRVPTNSIIVLLWRFHTETNYTRHTDLTKNLASSTGLLCSRPSESPVTTTHCYTSLIISISRPNKQLELHFQHSSSSSVSLAMTMSVVTG